MEKNNKNTNLDKNLFKPVKRDTKIHDKKFETKPIGYFKDAMIRFSKNRTNVIATIILGLLILLSILVPILTSKNYESQEPNLQYLPPKVPLLEKIGILDGTRYVENITVDWQDTDSETGLAFPDTFDVEYLVEGTLENYEESCTSSKSTCRGGLNVLRLDDADYYTIVSDTIFEFDETLNPTIEIDVENLATQFDSELNVYLSNVDLDDEDVEVTLDDLLLLGSIDTKGTHAFDVFQADDLAGLSTFESHVYIEIVGESNNAYAELESVTIDDDSNPDEPVQVDSGYELSIYDRAFGTGRYTRVDGTTIKANFRYDSYEAAFAPIVDNAFPASEYNEILEEYGDTCTIIDEDENDDQWEFTEGCPISKVNGINEGVPGPDPDDNFFSYQVELDYMIVNDIDGMPYYFFGTNSSGKDLFALTWLGLRTSLSIGLLVSLINITVGIVYGSIGGYYGGKVDIIMQRFSELVGRIPWLVTLSIFMALIGRGVLSLILILIVSGWIGVASVTRTQFYRYKGREYVLASRTLGAKDSRLIFRHILPNGIGTIITASILSIPLVIFTEAALSYLGFGIGHGQSFKLFGILDLSGVSIGVLLADGRTQMVARPYLTVFPAIIISILMITFNMFGNALRDAFNPSLRGSN